MSSDTEEAFHEEARAHVPRLSLIPFNCLKDGGRPKLPGGGTRGVTLHGVPLDCSTRRAAAHRSVDFEASTANFRISTLHVLNVRAWRELDPRQPPCDAPRTIVFVRFSMRARSRRGECRPA